MSSRSRIRRGNNNKEWGTFFTVKRLVSTGNGCEEWIMAAITIHEPAVGKLMEMKRKLVTKRRFSRACREGGIPPAP